MSNREKGLLHNPPKNTEGITNKPNLGGRPAKQDSVAEFGQWMNQERNYSLATARTYKSHVRRVFRATEGSSTTQTVVDEVFRQWHEEGLTTLPAIRGAWKLYVEWAGQAAHVDVVPVVPNNITRTMGEVHVLQPLPSKVRTALRQLISESMTVKQLVGIQWWQVAYDELHTAKAKKIHVENPNEKFAWVVTADPIRVLFEYAQPGGDLSTPLLPRTPGADTPYPYRAVLREIHTYTEEELEAKRLAMAPPAPPTGSALRTSPPDSESVPDLSPPPNPLQPPVPHAEDHPVVEGKPSWWDDLVGEGE